MLQKHLMSYVNAPLADVLRHESGLAWLDHTFKIDDFMVENLKKNKVGQIFEIEPPHFPGPGGANDVPTNREYHTITRGCILNEIVRRVDPQNRTIGEIIKQVKFIYSEKATKFCEIFTLLLTYVL